MDSYINDVFDRIYLINLNKHLDKRIKSIVQLRRYCIDFELVSAIDGSQGDALRSYKKYIKSPLGTLKYYKEFNALEVKNGTKFIESPGAMGYIFSYLKILESAKKKNYKKILILDDDILLHKNFEYEFKRFMFEISKENWKIIHLGASQYSWDSVDEYTALIRGFYYPRRLHTCGSFALGLDLSIVNELIKELNVFEAPVDHLPLGKMYEKYLGSCYVIFPNIVMPDVSDSSIRNGRCQYAHGKLMKWDINNFPFPLPKPAIAVIASYKADMKYLSSFMKVDNKPFYVKIYIRIGDYLYDMSGQNDRLISLFGLLKNKKNLFVVELEAGKFLTTVALVNYIQNQCEGTNKITNLKNVSLLP